MSDDGQMSGRVVVAVTVTVELSNWDNGCTLKQAYEQGRQEAEDRVRRALKDQPGLTVSGTATTRVVLDAPKVGRHG